MNPNDNNVNKNNVDYHPLSGDSLRELLKGSKGIESLWKKIKDNKDGKKSDLCKYEQDLAKMFSNFIDAFTTAKKQSVDFDLEKIFANKTQYNNMVTNLLDGDTKTATEFIKKFPHWTVQVCSLFCNSTHFKRISTGVNGTNMTTPDITSDSNFNVLKKTGEAKTGTESKKGFFKNISAFWNRYIKRGGWGKASKSKVTIELKKFGDYVNKPWRMWWELVADKDDKLSNSKPKSLLKEALSVSTVARQKKAVLNLFNVGQPASDTEQKPYKHNKNISGFNNNIENFPVDGQHVMFSVFSSLDKSLGNKVRKLFGAPVIEEKSFLDKFKKKSSEQKNTNANAIEMQNLNQQQQNQLANGGGNVQQPAQQPKEGGNKKPQIDLSFDKNKVEQINRILDDNGIPENDKVKDFNNDKVVIEVLSAIAGNNGIVYGKDREEFLVSLTKYFGLKGFDKNNINLICEKYVDDLPKEWQGNLAVKTVQRVRNLIRYSYYNRVSGKNNKLPEIKKK